MQRHRPWLLLSLAAGLASAQPAPNPDAAPPAAAAATTPPAGVPAAPEGAAEPGLRWRVPPILWSGSLAYELRDDRIEAEARTRQHLVTMNLAASSYLYQPWLATVGMELGLSQAQARRGLIGAETDDQFVTGALRLNVFPRSRFPFEFRYEVADSQIDSSLGTDFAYRSRTLVLTQRYRPVGGEFNASASYERRDQEGESFGDSLQQVLRGELSARWKMQNLTLTLSHNDNERRSTDEQSVLSTLAARHTYTPSNAITVESGVNWAHSADDLQVGTSAITLIEASTVGVWRPLDKPYSLNGSLRTLNVSDGDRQRSESVNLALGGSYDFSPNLRLGASTNFTRQNGETRTAWIGSLNATYQAPSVQIGGWDYDWFAASSLTGTRTGGEATQTLSSQLGHSVQRVLRDSAGNALSVALSQSVQVSHLGGGLRSDLPGSEDTALLRGWRRGLQHAATFTWNNSGERGGAFARLSLSDSRQLDGDRSRFQLVNFQLSGSHEFDRYNSWSGNLTLQRSFQNTRAEQLSLQDPFGFNRQISHNVSGELNWRHARAFGVPRLRFTSTLRASGDNQRTVLALPQDRESASWENRLDYQVGRLDTSLRYRMSEEEGRWRRSLALRVQRNFGE